MSAKYIMSHNYAYIPNPGGVADMANNLASALRQTTSDVIEVFPTDRGTKGRTLWRFLSEIELSLRHFFDHAVLLFPNYFAVPLPWSRAKSVVVVHDLQFKYYPGFQSIWKRLILEFSYRLAQRRAAGVIFISEATQSDFVKFYGPPTRSAVILTPIEVARTSPSSDSASKYVGAPYAIANFHSYPHKNLEKVFETFRRLRSVTPQLKLIVTGRQPKQSDLISKVGLEPESVVFTGFIDKQEVLNLIAGAEFFISMSLFEGFNMSAAEAAKLGRPLLLSDIAVHRELFGGYAFLADPAATSFDVQRFMTYLSNFSSHGPWELAEKTDPKYAAERYIQFFENVLDTPT